MFREMRRNRQLMSTGDTDSVLKRCSNGAGMPWDDDYPYARLTMFTIMVRSTFIRQGTQD